MATQSNNYLNQVLNSFNVGPIGNGFKPGEPVAIQFVPSTFKFTAANMLTPAAFITAIAALNQNASRAQRGFALFGLDKFTPKDKKTASFDTGLWQEMVVEFPAMWEFIVKLGQNNLSNYLEMAKMSNLAGYSFYVIDTNGNWWGTADTTGGGSLLPYTLQQFYVPKWNPMEPDKTSVYGCSISFASVTEFTTNFDYFVCPSFSSTSFTGLVNVVLNQPVPAAVTAIITAQTGSATTGIAVIGKMGQGTTDFFQTYGSILTIPCFVATDLTSGATLTISTMVFASIVVAGIPYYYGYATLSAAPASGHVVQLALAGPATVYGVIATYVVTETVQLGIDGANCCVKTFA